MEFKLRHYLTAKGLYEYVDGSTTVPESGASDREKNEYFSKAAKALSYIVLAVSDDLLYLITECEDAQSAWNKLQLHFERDTLANRLFLKKKYFRTVMNERESIENHLKYMKEITNKLAAIKAPVSEEDQVVTLLGSLPDSYATLVTALEAPGEKLTPEYVSIALLNEEQKRDNSDAKDVGKTDTALSTGHS
jgi:hypothetical protein